MNELRKEKNLSVPVLAVEHVPETLKEPICAGCCDFKLQRKQDIVLDCDDLGVSDNVAAGLDYFIELGEVDLLVLLCDE